MNKIGWAVGGLILIAAVFGAYSLIQHSEPKAPASGTGNATVGATGASSVVTYSDAGFSPASLSVAQGTTVTWENRSGRTMWVEGSNGGDCNAPSSEMMNECEAVSTGGTYSHTFTRIGTSSYSNHEEKDDKGTIVVNQAAATGPINPQAVPE